MTSGSVGAGEGAVVRKASGLVRAFSPWDWLYYNILAVNPFLLTALTFTIVIVFFPGANPWAAILIAGAFCCAEAVVYALLVAAMPRSGGDYVFQSRILGGGWATFTTFSGIVVTQILAISFIGGAAAFVVLSPFLTLFGAYYNAEWLADLGEWFGTNDGLFAATLITATWATVINVLGLRPYALLQRWFFIPGLIGLTIGLLIMLVQTRDDFIRTFNEFMADKYGVDNAYQSVIDAAAGAGFETVGFSLKWTLAAIPLAAFGLVFVQWGVYQAGEVRKASVVRWNIFALLGAEVISIFIAASVAALLLARVGFEFFAASGYLFFVEPDLNPLPIPPYFSFFASLVVGSPALAWLLLITALGWLWMWFPNLTLAFSRVVMAMSFDRVLPEWAGRVNARTHTPVNACLVALVGYVIVAVVLLADSNLAQFFAANIVLSIVTFGTTMLAATWFWKRRPTLWQSAPQGVRTSVGGIPVMVILGPIFFAFSGFIVFLSFQYDEFAINTTKGIAFMCFVWFISAILWPIAYFYRKRTEGLDMREAYRELPVE